MAIPLTALTFEDPMDPSDVVDYEVVLFDEENPSSSILDGGEDVDSHTVELGPEAVAVGMQLGTGSRESSIVGAVPTVKFWLNVDPAEQSDVVFDGEGVTIPVVITITTDSNPSRTRQKTYLVKVAQQ